VLVKRAPAGAASVGSLVDAGYLDRYFAEACPAGLEVCLADAGRAHAVERALAGVEGDGVVRLART
jgi:hypothetical protein